MEGMTMTHTRRDFLKAATATAVLTAALPVQAKGTPTMSKENFADVNGQHIFYSVHGAGKPLILLHGGIDPDSFGSNLAELAKGLQTAILHPDMVDRLVLLAARMRQDDAYSEVLAALNQLEANAAMLGGSVKASPLGQAYPDVDWTNLFRKVGDLTKRPFDWSADVAKLKTRTLLVFADADYIPPEHMVEFWKALGGGQRDAGIDGSLRPANQFAIVPNTTHYTLAVEPMLPEIVERFLRTK
jgi:pimeloyl-ACP methyl ester carboxylesterase